MQIALIQADPRQAQFIEAMQIAKDCAERAAAVATAALVTAQRHWDREQSLAMMEARVVAQLSADSLRASALASVLIQTGAAAANAA